MRIPTWRLVLTGGAITILAVAGIGLAAAASMPAAPVNPAVAGPAAASNVDVDVDAEAATIDAWRAGRLLRAGRHLVHAEMTVTDRDGKLVYLQLDHGTVQSIGGGTLTIAEAGGSTETVTTDDATKVHVGRKAGDLGDVTVGAEVFVQSRVDGGTVLAKRIVVVPATGS